MTGKKRRRILLSVISILLLLGAISAYTVYQWIEASNVSDRADKVIFIPGNTSFEGVVEILDSTNAVDHLASFIRVSKWMKYTDQNIKSGKYTLKGHWSNREIISTLRSGNQTPINLIVNNVRTLADLAGKLSKQIEEDSLTLISFFQQDSILEKYQVTKENMLALFIPNTYQLYWNVSPAALLDRLKSEHDKYWSQSDRLKKAEALQLTTAEVYTLASIVEKETQASVERPTVAGLYLNRLNKGIPLQADPTVVFASGIFDLRRVLNKHLEIDSPYNTYKFSGLPPGPIYMPTIESLESVLNAESHDYLYMCARPDNSGLHAFAASLSGHAVNANRYRNWLNQRGIR